MKKSCQSSVRYFKPTAHGDIIRSLSVAVLAVIFPMFFSPKVFGGTISQLVNGGGSLNFVNPGRGLAQTFFSTSDVQNLSTISVYYVGANSSLNAPTLTLALYAGNSPQGAPFATRSMLMAAKGSSQWITFDLTGVTLQVGATFTFAVTGSGTGSLAGGLAYGSGYSNGFMWDIFSPSSISGAPGNDMMFEIVGSPTYATLTGIANPANGGSVVGGGSFPENSQQQLTATPATNWIFTSWSDGNTTNPRTVTVPPGGATFTANFTHQTAALSVVASPTAGGTVTVVATGTSSGTFDVGSQQQITATASTCYIFTGWSVNGVPDGNTDNPRTVIVPSGGGTFTANFLNVLQNSVSRVVAPGNVVKMTAIFVPQGNVTLSQAASICGVDHFNWLQFIKAVPSHWRVTSGGNVITPPLLDPINTSDQSQFYTVTSSRAPGIQPLSFPPPDGESFDAQVYYWNEPDERITYSSNRGFLFTDTPKFYRDYLPDAQDAVWFDTVLVGVKADGSHLPPWTGIGTNVTWKSSTKCDAQFHTVGGNVTFVGYFKLVDETGTPNVVAGNVFDVAVDMPYSISASANSVSRGTISGTGTYVGGTTANLAATGNSGFGFTNWTEGGVVVDNASQNYSFFVSAPRSLVANFQPNSWSSWKTTNFTSQQLADVTISGEMASPAGDGVPNLLKYASLMNPNVRSLAGLPTGGRAIVGEADCLTLTYVKNDVASDLSYNPEWSSDLLNWSSAGLTEQVLSDDGATKQVQASVALNSAPKVFMRLRVTRP